MNPPSFPTVRSRRPLRAVLLDYALMALAATMGLAMVAVQASGLADAILRAP